MENTPSQASVENVSDEEFIQILKERRPDLSEFLVQRIRAAQVGEKSGPVKILVNNKGFPTPFLPYLETHFLWEAHMANRKGFNLAKASRREAKKALKGIYDRIPEIRIDNLLKAFVEECRFDFKHEFAVWKEYQKAEADGVLDAYHTFMTSLKETERAENVNSPAIVRQTQNDVKIRQSIFNKIRTGSKHRFNKRLSA